MKYLVGITTRFERLRLDCIYKVKVVLKISQHRKKNREINWVGKGDSLARVIVPGSTKRKRQRDLYFKKRNPTSNYYFNFERERAINCKTEGAGRRGAGVF